MQESRTYEEKLIQGSVWLSVGNLFSRLIGAIYIIPWYAWMGEHARQANGLFTMGYTFYALFMMLSTAGLPGAIAKQVARYNSMGRYRESQQLFKSALAATALLGLVAGGVMFLCSPLLAALSGGGAALVPVIRSLSVAVVAFPCMSILRGYFQGQQEMRPSAISQIIEQLIRVFYMLLSVFIIMKVMEGSYLDAVVQSTFAASVGMIGSYAVLLFYWVKDRELRAWQWVHSVEGNEKKPKHLLLETSRQAIPFILLSSGITLYKLIDQLSFIHVMKGLSNYGEEQLIELYALFSANPDKLTMVIVALGSSIALTSLPMLTELFTKRQRDPLAKLVATNLQLFLFVMIPTITGMILLAYPINTLFYSADRLGSNVLIAACLVSFVSALFLVLSTVLQGISHSRYAVRYLLVGLGVKIVLQVPMILMFEVYGPLIASFIGFTVTSLFCFHRLQTAVAANYRLVARRALLIILSTSVMFILVTFSRQGLYLFLDPSNRVQALLCCLILSGFGALIYLYIMLKIRFVDLLMKDKARKWRKKLRIK